MIKRYRIEFKAQYEFNGIFGYETDARDIYDNVLMVLGTKEFRFGHLPITDRYRHYPVSLENLPESIVLYVNYPNATIETNSELFGPYLSIEEESYDSDLRSKSNDEYYSIIETLFPVNVLVNTSNLYAFTGYFESSNKFRQYIDHFFANNCKIKLRTENGEVVGIEFSFEHTGNDEGIEDFFSYSVYLAGYDFSVVLLSIRHIKDEIFIKYTDD